MSSPPMKPFLHDFKKMTRQMVKQLIPDRQPSSHRRLNKNALQHFPSMLCITFTKDTCPNQESQTHKEELTKRLQRANMKKHPKDFNAQIQAISCKNFSNTHTNMTTSKQRKTCKTEKKKKQFLNFAPQFTLL